MAELLSLRTGDCVGLPDQGMEDDQENQPLPVLLSKLLPSVKELQERFSTTSQVKEVPPLLPPPHPAVYHTRWRASKRLSECGCVSGCL